MSFFAILVALILEQARPLGPSNPVHTGMRAWARASSRSFDTGTPVHAWVAWGFAVCAPALLAGLVHFGLEAGLGWPLATVWNVAVLYLTLGFRQFSHHFTGIRDALDLGDEAQARERLAAWMRVEIGDLPRTELLRQVLEHSVLAAHRHVFGVLAWYSVGAALGLGPTGAVLYRMADFCSRYWVYRHRAQLQPVSDGLRLAAAQAWRLVDWLPARATALAFAVVGSFEEAIDAWRHHAQRLPDDNDGVIVAASAGAMGVRLGDAETGADAQGEHLRSVVGLVWRTVVVWLVLLALLTLARLIG